jgi:hypothetical protein
LLFGLHQDVAPGSDGCALSRSVAYIADFLCRSEKEVRDKVIELEPAKDADRK